jgi:hypothetical protein
VGRCPDALAIYLVDTIADGLAEDGKPKAYIQEVTRHGRGEPAG